MSIVAELEQLLGPVVYIRWPKGKKGDKKPGWAKLTRRDMTPEYLATLPSGNIGILLGKPSGDLCAIDCDRDDFASAFLAVNPALKATLQTHGARGRVFWLRIDGEYPLKTAKLKTHSGEDAGEFRSTGQSIIYGTHPEGMEYQFVVRQPALTVTFASVVWPTLIANPPRVGQKEGQMRTDVVVGSVGVSALCPLSVHSSGYSESLVEPATIQEAVELAIPLHPHQNNPKLFSLARGLMTVSEKNGAPISKQDARAAFDAWYALTKERGLLRREQTKDDYLMQFMTARKYAKIPLGPTLDLKRVLAIADKSPPPPEASMFEDPRARQLVALCRELQRCMGPGKEWFLSCRLAASVLGVDDFHVTARWMFCMVESDVLNLIKRGVGIKASRYTWKGDL